MPTATTLVHPSLDGPQNKPTLSVEWARQDSRETGHKDGGYGDLLSGGKIQTPHGRERDDDQNQVKDDVGISGRDAEGGHVDARAVLDSDVPEFGDGVAGEEDEEQSNRAVHEIDDEEGADDPFEELDGRQPVVQREHRRPQGDDGEAVEDRRGVVQLWTAETFGSVASSGVHHVRLESGGEAATHQQEGGTDVLQLDVPDVHAKSIVCFYARPDQYGTHDHGVAQAQPGRPLSRTDDGIDAECHCEELEAKMVRHAGPGIRSLEE